MYYQLDRRPAIEEPLPSWATTAGSVGSVGSSADPIDWVFFNYSPNRPIPMPSLEEVKAFKLAYIELQTINKQDTYTLQAIMEGYMRDILELSVRIKFYIILFQIAQACYSLNLSRATHNDLHAGNVWITVKDPADPKNFVKIRYVTDQTVYNIRSNICCRLYDFDRAYAEKLGYNDLLAATDRSCFDYSQCNYVSNSKDFVKVLCYFIKVIMFLLPDDLPRAELIAELYSLILPADEVIVRPGYTLEQLTRDSYTSDQAGCFLRMKDAKGNWVSIPKDIYNLYEPLPYIMKQLSIYIKDMEDNLTAPTTNQKPVIFTDEPDFTFISRSVDFDKIGSYIMRDIAGNN
jgi:hypothetical protein